MNISELASKAPTMPDWYYKEFEKKLRAKEPIEIYCSSHNIMLAINNLVIKLAKINIDSRSKFELVNLDGEDYPAFTFTSEEDYVFDKLSKTGKLYTQSIINLEVYHYQKNKCLGFVNFVRDYFQNVSQNEKEAFYNSLLWYIIYNICGSFREYFEIDYEYYLKEKVTREVDMSWRIYWANDLIKKLKPN